MSEVRNNRKTRVGVVKSSAMDKTISVMVERRLQHPLYGKFVKKSNKFMAHDEKECGVGDLVEIVQTRPMSARKRWRVSRVVRKAVVAGGEA